MYIVAVPAAYGTYNAEVQKKLMRAEKKKILEDLKEDAAYRAGGLQIWKLNVFC